MSSVVNNDFDDTLKQIAKALHKNEDIDNLGKALGFGIGDIARKIEENGKQGGNYMGTLDLLRTWQNKQTPSTEHAALKEALLKVGLKHLAVQFMSNRMDRIVTDKELRKLAGCLPASSFTDVAIYLGLEYADYDNIKLQNQASLKDANFKMLMKWKQDDGGKVGDLDKALKEAQCGGFRTKMCNYFTVSKNSCTMNTIAKTIEKNQPKGILEGFVHHLWKCANITASEMLRNMNLISVG